MSDEKTFVTQDKDDAGRSPTMDVIELDDQMYSETFQSCCGNGPEKPWYVAFIKKRRSKSEFWQSAFVVNMMRLLADEYGGAV